MHTKRPIVPPRLTACLILLAAMVPGCGPLAWIAQGAAGGKRTYQVKAQYLGLANQKVAVMVAADEYTLFQAPGAPLKVSRAVSAKIATHVPGVEIVPPQEVIDFQLKHPYWSAVPYSELTEDLGVDRIVLIDLIEYRTHEPGNAHVWQGVITGEVGVVEARGEDPDNFAFSTVVRARFPQDSAIGLVNSDDQTIELGMLVTFARDAAGLFYDHEVVK